VFTADFVNDTVERFAVNMGLFALFLWGLAVASSHSGPGKWRDVILVGAIFLSATLSILYLILLGGSGTGSSGIVYGAAGVMSGIAIVQRGWTAPLREKGLSRPKVNSYVLLFGLLAEPPAAVYGGGNAIVHVVALLLGLAMGYGIARTSLAGGWSRDAS